ncbi:MAG: hypothetical protein Q4G33_06475 [bacterium]|nr:hypothetical protein [bacterium]
MYHNENKYAIGGNEGLALVYYGDIRITPTTAQDLCHELEALPMDPKSEKIESPFPYFPTGTSREDIWHWFEET